MTQGRIVVGEPECACAAQVLARNQAASAGSKAISWGPPQVPPLLKEDPSPMEEKGDLRSGGFGPEGSGVCLHVRQVPGHRAQVFEPRGGRRLFIAGCKCPAGLRDGVGTPRATEGTWPLESSLENSPPRPLVHKSILPTVSVRGWESFWAVFLSGNRVVF